MSTKAYYLQFMGDDNDLIATARIGCMEEWKIESTAEDLVLLLSARIVGVFEDFNPLAIAPECLSSARQPKPLFSLVRQKDNSFKREEVA